jgi:STE24 endopeptidase
VTVDEKDGSIREPGSVLDEDRQESAAEYARIRRWLLLVEMTLSLGYALIWLVTGTSTWWRELLSLLTPSRWLLVPLFAGGFGAGLAALSAPLSYYSGFVLPHRYGLSHQSLRSWLWDRAKGLAVSAVLGLVMLELVYWLLEVSPKGWWLWAALAMFVLSVLLSSLVPVVVLPLFYKLAPLEDEALKRRLTRLAQRSGTRVRGVYTYDESRKTSTANAALVGMGGTRRIILADTLLASYQADEVETILAHELGHHVHRDLGLGILVQSALNVAALWLAGAVMAWGVTEIGLGGPADTAGMPLLFLVLSLYALVTMPLGNIWSRWRERLADSYALQATDNPQAFIGAMTRLANQNLAEVEPPGWVESLLYSHPSISKRVAMAEAYAKTLSPATER